MAVPAAYPDEIGTELQVGTNHVRLSFAFEVSGTFRVMLDQPRLLQLIAELSGRIERGPMTPISLARIRPATSLKVESSSFRRQSAEGVQATFVVQAEGRLVTLSLDLSDDDVNDLVREHGGKRA